MRERQTIRIRLRLLTLALALALTWYTLNPAPGLVRRVELEDEPSDEKRREAKPLLRVSYNPRRTEADWMESATIQFSPAAEMDIEDLEWPEVVDVVN